MRYYFIKQSITIISPFALETKTKTPLGCQHSFDGFWNKIDKTWHVMCGTRDNRNKTRVDQKLTLGWRQDQAVVLRFHPPNGCWQHEWFSCIHQTATVCRSHRPAVFDPREDCERHMWPWPWHEHCLMTTWKSAESTLCIAEWSTTQALQQQTVRIAGNTSQQNNLTLERPYS